MKFLICYDIANPKRLNRVANRLEKSAQRVQKSVFLFDDSQCNLEDVQNDLLEIIQPDEDKVQAWPLANLATRSRWDAGNAYPVHASFAIVGQTATLIVE